MKRRVLALLLGIAMLSSEFSSIPHVFSVSRALAMTNEEAQQIEPENDTIIEETENLVTDAGVQEKMELPEEPAQQSEEVSEPAAADNEAEDTAADEPAIEPAIMLSDAVETESVSTQNNEPTEAPIAEPTEALTAEPTEAPTVEPTEAPTAEPTEAPTVEPTEAPTAEPTEAPTVEPTEAPTAEPTEAPTVEPTEAPTAEPTEAPTVEPTEAPTVEPTEAPTAEPTEAPTVEPSEAPTVEPSVEPTEVPIVEPTAEPTPEATEEPMLPLLEAGIRSGIAYLFAGEGNIPVKMTVSGGVAPFVVELSITANGEQVDAQRARLESEGVLETAYAPQRAGDHVISMCVTDAVGQNAVAKTTVPVAAHDVEYPATWEATMKDVELTGDWREDLVAIARSQLGYQESRINFVIEDGVRRGYTRYGDWYGAPYTDWCGAFVSFCLSYAGISKKAYPQNAGVAAYMEAIDERGALEENGYMPGRGDLVFFMWDGEETPSHMGIVENVDETTVWTIEGNAAGSVVRKSYALDAQEIIAYANTSELMRQAGVDDEKTAAPDIQLSGEAVTAKDSVNMRSQAKQGSALVRKLRDAGTTVVLLGATDQDDMRWYLAQYNDAIGYIRSDLLTLVMDETAENEADEPVAEPTAEPTDEPVTEPTAEPTAEPVIELAVEPTADPAGEEEIFFAPEETETPAVVEPTIVPEETETVEPTAEPHAAPTEEPSHEPESEEEDVLFVPGGMSAPVIAEPTIAPEEEPTAEPTQEPDQKPTEVPEQEQPAELDQPSLPENEATAGEAELEDAAAPEGDKEQDLTLDVGKPVAAPENTVTENEQIATEATPGEAEEEFAAEQDELSRMKYICGLEEHAHTGDCIGDFITLICDQMEHQHDETCILLIDPLVSSMTSDAEQFVIGESTRVTVEAAIAGGYGPFAVSMRVYQGDVLLQNAQMTTEGNAIRFYFVPETAGAYTAEITVTDADGFTTQASLPMTIAEPAPEYFCGLEAHAHGESCVDADGDEVCDLVEHAHDESCLNPPAEEPEDEITTLTLTPDENGNVSFTIELHAALTYYLDRSVYVGDERVFNEQGWVAGNPYTFTFTPGESKEYIVRFTQTTFLGVYRQNYRIIIEDSVKYFCGLETHAHDDDCYEAGELVCGLEAHEHDLYCLAEKLEISLFAENQTLDYNDPFAPVTVDAVITGGVEPYTVGMHVRGERLPQNEQTEAGGEQEDAAVKPVLNDTTTVSEAEQEATPSEAAEMARTEHSFSFVPVATGAHTVTVSVTDADGRKTQSVITVDIDRVMSEWEEALQNVVITGNSREDIPAIARTQLGYTERELDLMFGLTRAALTSTVYTRYGEWYGEQRDKWSSLFAVFCLHYAGVTGMPLSIDAAPWAQQLEAANLFKDADSYMPLPGDVVFLDTDGDQIADETALVDAVNVEAVPFKMGDDGSITYVDLENASDGKASTIQDDPYILWKRAGSLELIAGDVDGAVATISLDVTDPFINDRGILLLDLTAGSEPEIVGYGSVADNEASDDVSTVIELIDAMPSEEEYNALLEAYEETESEEAFAAYSKALSRIETAYYRYMELLPEQRAYVANVDDLMALEYVWSRMFFLAAIASDAPETDGYTPTSEFVELNLYDYGSNINANYKSNNKYPGFQWNGGAYHRNGYTYNRHTIDFIDFGNSMITDFEYGSSASGTNGISANRQNIAGQGGDINEIDNTSWGITNRPIGFSTGDEVIQRTLGTDGYPALADGTSLSYLFKDGTYAEKKNTSSIDGLFLKNATSGEYEYNSRETHAQYSGNFFQRYKDIITPNFITYPFGNFLPFNKINDSTIATQVNKITRAISSPNSSEAGYIQTIINRLLDGTEDSTENQLINMLAKYRDSLGANNATSSNRYTWNAADVINDYFHVDGSTINPNDPRVFKMSDPLLDELYNIDWNVDTNFFFGMEMKMNFMQPKDGLVGTDRNDDGIPDYPMKFYFTGDDDVWVYIDDVLFLDLSGIHRHVGGMIDFVGGKVHYYALDVENGGDATKEYTSYTFSELLSAAGKSTDVLENGRFKDYTTHKFNFYYMERGSGSSVCRINFNFPLLRKNAISVLKEVTGDIDKAELLGNPDYKFQILKANADGTKTNAPFIVKDESAEGILYNIYDGEPTDGKKPIGTGVTGKDGVFTLKAGQSAEFVGISENAGKYYVRELLDGNELAQYGKITVSGETATQVDNIVIDGETFSGLDSPVKDMSNGTTAFRFINNFESDKLGSIEIEKKLTDDQMQDAMNAPSNKLYRFFVTLDGEPLPVGTVYIVDDGIEREDPLTRTVEEAGIVMVRADEKIVVDKIYAGLKYAITEDEPDYNVSYKVTGDSGYGTNVDEVTGKTTLSGVIRTSTMIEILATNTVKGDQETPKVIKSLPNYDSGTYTYTFNLVEINMDDMLSYTVVENGYTDQITIDVTSKESVQKAFKTMYFPPSMAGKTYCYLITEDVPPGGSSHDTTKYIYMVEVKQDAATGNVTAEPKLYKLGTSSEDSSLELLEVAQFEFVNKLLGDIHVEKKVNGIDTDVLFPFELTLKGDLLPGTYEAETSPGESDNPTEISLTGTEQTITIYLGRNQQYAIYGLPIGTEWSIKELEPDYPDTDYTPSYAVKIGVNGVVTEDTSQASGALTSDNVWITITNTQLFELPSTGGTGTYLYTMGGILLMAASIFLLYNQRKYRKEDYET